MENTQKSFKTPDFPQTKQEWENLMVSKHGKEWLKSDDKKLFDRDWPRFKTLL